MALKRTGNRVVPTLKKDMPHCWTKWEVRESCLVEEEVAAVIAETVEQMMTKHAKLLIPHSISTWSNARPTLDNKRRSNCRM